MPKISKNSSWKKYKKRFSINQEEKMLRNRQPRRRLAIVCAIICSIAAGYFGFQIYASGKLNSMNINFFFVLVVTADIISISQFIIARKPPETRQRQQKVKEHYTDRLPKYFVDVHCQDINPGDDTDKHPVRQSLREKVWEWLFDPQQKKWRYLQLLGDFGTGKTTFCFYLGQEIIATMLSLDVEIIELGTENLDLQDKLAKIIYREKTILMLDAYDEYRKRGRADNEFLELQELTHNFFKVIITSRTNYFTCAEAEPYLDNRYVSYFNEEQVKQFIQINHGRKWQKHWDMLDRYQQLADLSLRVIVLNYLNEDILKSIQADEEQGVEINNFQIYEKIVTNIFAKVKELTADKLLPPDQALQIMSLLGFYMICCNGETQIHYEVLDKKLLQVIEQFQLTNSKIATYLKKEDLLDGYSHLIAEIRTRTFLVSDNAGYYRFTHLSFAEYFAARFILEVLIETIMTAKEIEFKLTSMILKFLSEANKPEVLIKLIDIIKPEGKDSGHLFLQKSISGDKVIFDFATGLVWQQGGSEKYMHFEKAKKWIKELNQKSYAGYKDWRLPTFEEARSLMKSEQRQLDLANGVMNIDPVFDAGKRWIWTCDLVKRDSTYKIVSYYAGVCNWDSFFDGGYYGCVRAVRSARSSQK